MKVDVCIVGSGFGGSISAFRLAELYRAAGQQPSILVLERGQRHLHTDFRQSMDIELLARLYGLVQGLGAQIVLGDGVGGSSNLYLAASLRSPRETFERRDHRPDDGPDRRIWPSQITRAALDPYYARAERALRVQRPTWNQVSKSGGLWAATLAAAGHTCDRVPQAIDLSRCVQAKWCHTGCIFGAKNSVMTNYLASAEQLGVEVRPNSEAELIAPSQARPYRYLVTAAQIGDSRQPSGQTFEVECKVLILAAGAMGNAPLLMRSRPLLPSLSGRVGKHLGINGDHIAGVEYDERKVRDVLGLPGYGQFYKGNHITTMSYDWWKGRDGTRFTLQEIFLSNLAHALYDDGRAPSSEPTWWGLQKKAALSTFNNHIEILAMVEDTHDGEFLAPPPTGSHIRPNAGPVGIGPFKYELSDQSVAVREAANQAITSVVTRNGLARYLKPTYRNVSAAHPLGGCRMADSKDFGVVDHRNEVFDNEGMFCMDSSAIPTSLGVNPSLTISAVAERACEQLIARSANFGLPVAPAGFRPGVPGVTLGPHTEPHRAASDAAIDAKVRSYG
ncbi:MAG: enediyne biosynthesis protein [Thermoleophilaceae bacterium]|nr:enediyne biosynthesis protein [Thermoleophilaceae bacterium]